MEVAEITAFCVLFFDLWEYNFVGQMHKHLKQGSPEVGLIAE